VTTDGLFRRAPRHATPTTDTTAARAPRPTISSPRHSITRLYAHFEKAVAETALIKEPERTDGKGRGEPHTDGYLKSPEYLAYEKAFDRALDRCSRIADQIILAPANSIPEMLLKIRVAIWSEDAQPLEKLDAWKPHGLWEGGHSMHALVTLRDDLRRMVAPADAVLVDLGRQADAAYAD
jgi:hypothetical protein